MSIVSIDAEERRKLNTIQLDALPYIDSLYNDDPSIRADVNTLISEEMQKSSKKLKEYVTELKNRTVDPDFKTTQYFGADLDMLRRGEKRPEIDFSAAYRISLPKDDASEEEWQYALDRAKIAAEVEVNHNLNLELLKKYGSQAWMKTFQRVDAIKNNIDSKSQALQSQIDTLNRKRRQDQVKIAQQLNDYEIENAQLCSQNHALALERYRLDREIKKTKVNQ